MLHDDRNSRYIVSTDEGGIWRDEAFTAADLVNRRWYSDANWYVTHNGFTGCRRQVERTRQLNALFFDIDCHGAPFEKISGLVDRIVSSIDGAVKASRLPRPSMIIDSGRGVHLHYVLSRSVPYRFKGKGEVNVKGERLFRKVQEQIADILDEIVAGIEYVVVDRSVFDHTRVSRIPGTWNARAWRFARLLSVSEDYHHLEDLKSYEPVRKREEQKRAQGRILTYNPLMMARLSKVEELQKLRGFRCEGNRERMAFVYYNTAVQVYQHSEAAELLNVFNARFDAPLPQREIDNIVISVDKNVNVRGEKGFYLLGAKKVVELLSLTEEEMAATNFFSSKRMMERMESKRKTKERRDARNAEIVRLYSEGEVTQKGVSEAVGCSLSTVKAVLASEGLTRRRRASEARSKIKETALKEAVATVLSSPAVADTKSSKKWQPCHVVISLKEPAVPLPTQTNSVWMRLPPLPCLEPDPKPPTSKASFLAPRWLTQMVFSCCLGCFDAVRLPDAFRTRSALSLLFSRRGKCKIHCYKYPPSEGKRNILKDLPCL